MARLKDLEDKAKIIHWLETVLGMHWALRATSSLPVQNSLQALINAVNSSLQDLERHHKASKQRISYHVRTSRHHPSLLWEDQDRNTAPDILFAGQWRFVLNPKAIDQCGMNIRKGLWRQKMFQLWKHGLFYREMSHPTQQRSHSPKTRRLAHRKRIQPEGKKHRREGTLLTRNRWVAEVLLAENIVKSPDMEEGESSSD